MRGAVLVLVVAASFGAPLGGALAQGTLVAQAAAVRFDRPIFTTESAALCPRQHQIAALRRALDDNDRAAFDRAAREGACKLVGPDIRLAVVARPGCRAARCGRSRPWCGTSLSAHCRPVLGRSAPGPIKAPHR